MRATIAWSYDLLSTAEQELFRRLTVFNGGCSLSAIEELCGGTGDAPMDILDGIEALQRNSLLQLEDTATKSRDSGCWRPSTNTGWKGWRPAAEEEELSGGTPTATWRSPRKLPRHLHPRDGVGWTGWRSTTKSPCRHALVHRAPKRRNGPAAGERPVVVLVCPRSRHRGPDAAGVLLACPEASAVTAPRAEALLGAGQLALTQGDYTAAWTSLQQSIALHRELADERGRPPPCSRPGSWHGSKRNTRQRGPCWRRD